MSFDKSEISVTFGEGFTAPVLNNPHQLPVYYMSSNSSVATINGNGKLSLRNTTGSTTISAIFDGDDTYLPDTISYQLNVTQSLEAADLFYKKVTTQEELVKGAQYIIVCEARNCAMGNISADDGYGSKQNISIIDNNLIVVGNITSNPLVLTLTNLYTTDNTYRFKLPNGHYLTT